MRMEIENSWLEEQAKKILAVAQKSREKSILVISCFACDKKLWWYRKHGQGELLRCYKDRIEKVWNMNEHDGKVWCKCGNAVGTDKGSFIELDRNATKYSGTKIKT